MTKTKFLLSFIIVIFLLFLGIFFIGNSSTLYLDISSLILGLLIPYIIISFIYTPKEQINFNKEIFTPIGSGDKKLLKTALLYFKSFKTLLISCTVTVTLMTFIAMMANLEDTASIGPNLAVMLIVPFYISIFMLVVIEPLRTAAEKNLET